MSLYKFFYKNVITHTPERIVEYFGAPFISLSTLFGKEFDLPVNIDGIKFMNPFGMSSGWADTPRKIKHIHKLGAGIVISKTITEKKRKGNPRPRLIRGENQLINSMGLPNNGVKWWTDNYKKKKQPSILSIRGETTEQWEKLIQQLEPVTDIFELNFSCPNLHDGIMDIVSSKKAVEDISSITKKRIWIKLSPEYSPNNNLKFVDSIRQHINGVTTINTLPIKDNRLGNPQKRGGLSGNPIYPELKQILKKLRENYSASDLPIFAVGGINSPERAWEIFRKYQSIPLTLTAFLMNGPYFFRQVLDYFQKQLEISDHSTLQSFID